MLNNFEPRISDGDRDDGLHVGVPVDLEVGLGHLLGRALVGDPVGLGAKFGLLRVVQLGPDVSHLERASFRTGQRWVS